MKPLIVIGLLAIGASALVGCTFEYSEFDFPAEGEQEPEPEPQPEPAAEPAPEAPTGDAGAE